MGDWGYIGLHVGGFGLCGTQLSVRLLFLSGDEEGDGGDVGCCLGLCGYHLGCVAVQLVYVDYPFICGWFGVL